jgi:hypothetical protein
VKKHPHRPVTVTDHDFAVNGVDSLTLISTNRRIGGVSDQQTNIYPTIKEGDSSSWALSLPLSSMMDGSGSRTNDSGKVLCRKKIRAIFSI